MWTTALRPVALLALLAACLPLTAQTITRAQLEQQYKVTCSAQNIAASPFLRTQCIQMRATIDQLPADEEPREDEDADSSPPRPAHATPGGAIGDPGMLSRERVYDDQCVRKAPRTDVERAQCQRLYQMINPATNGGPSSAAQSSRGDTGAPRGSGGTPVDQRGRECVALVDQKLERWGTNNENTTLRYFFSNGCNHSMNVTGKFSQGDGTERPAMTVVCPGRTESLVCSGFAGGKGCARMTAWGFEPSSGSGESCRR